MDLVVICGLEKNRGEKGTGTGILGSVMKIGGGGAIEMDGSGNPGRLRICGKANLMIVKRMMEEDEGHNNNSQLK